MLTLRSHVEPSTVEALRRDCRRLARGAAGLSAVLAALLALEAFGPWLVSRPSAGVEAATLIDAVAPCAYLAGLWRLGSALARFAEHGRFATSMTDGIRAVGLVLVCGGLFQTFAAPGLKIMVGRSPGYYLGLDAASCVLAALGIGLLVVARLFRRAGAMEAELDLIL